MFDFKFEEVREVYERLNSIIPIEFRLCSCIDTNATLDCGEEQALIQYKGTANEKVDILHELLHVEMFYSGQYSQLAWVTGDSRITDYLKRMVYHIRNTADDTHVFMRLFRDFGVFPLSRIFFDECKEDLRQGRIRAMDSDIEVNRYIVGAWRLRMAELACGVFRSRIYPSCTDVCRKFLSRFCDSDAHVIKSLELMRKYVRPEDMLNTEKHGTALERIRDHLGHSGDDFYLARWRRQKPKWFRLCRIEQTDRSA